MLCLFIAKTTYLFCIAVFRSVSFSSHDSSDRTWDLVLARQSLYKRAMPTVMDLLRKITAALYNVLSLSISRYCRCFQYFLVICSILITTLIHVNFWMFSGGTVQHQCHR